jgi:hypothetical protein
MLFVFRDTGSKEICSMPVVSDNKLVSFLLHKIWYCAPFNA